MNPSIDLNSLSTKVVDVATTTILEIYPELKTQILKIFEHVFVPRAITRQVALAFMLESGVVMANQVISVAKKIYCNFSSRSRLIRNLELKQQKADSQDEWMDLAEQIDSINADDVWRTELSCPLYESDRISSRIDEFVHLMRRRDIFDLMFTLRGGIARNTFGLLHEGLFSKAIAGTKVLVETYHNIVCTSLDYICDSDSMPGHEIIPTEAKLAFFNETRHMYGRSALLLSGGAALGFYHVGVVKALMDNGLLPRVLSGASAGSIVSAMIGTRSDEECVKDLFNGEGTNSPGHSGTLILDFFRPFESPANMKDVLHSTAGAFHDGKKTWQVLLPVGIRKATSIFYDLFTGHKRPRDVLKNDTEHFRNCCKMNIGNFTFQEAFDRTGRILNIIVSPQNRSDPPRLLNYLSSPHVLIWSAAVASSSLPGVFEPNRLLVKDADGTERLESASIVSFIDGSMEQDLPMQQLSEMFNVNHFIISQANPHAVLLSSFGVQRSVWNKRLTGLVTGVLLFLKKQVKAWIENLVVMIGGQRIAPMWDTRRGFKTQFFTQEYEGRDIDVSLIPWINHRTLFSAFMHCLYNPSEKDFTEWGRAAERETWRHIPKIKSHVAVEMTLDKCVQRLRKRIIKERRERKDFSENQIISNRVPSFFTSASLVNMSGLGITDRFNVNEFEEKSIASEERSRGAIDEDFIQKEVPRGWRGMGLRGNFSNGSLNRSTSGGSGLFLMDEIGDENPQKSNTQLQRQQAPRQDTCENSMHGRDDAVSHTKEIGYVKTSSMAEFYYRKKCHGSLD